MSTQKKILNFHSNVYGRENSPQILLWDMTLSVALERKHIGALERKYR